MSSWANRHILQKRNISQIPQELRPNIISRAERPEIILSETFQEVTYNEIVINTRKQESIKETKIQNNASDNRYKKPVRQAPALI